MRRVVATHRRTDGVEVQLLDLGSGWSTELRDAAGALVSAPFPHMREHGAAAGYWFLRRCVEPLPLEPAFVAAVRALHAGMRRRRGEAEALEASLAGGRTLGLRALLREWSGRANGGAAVELLAQLKACEEAAVAALPEALHRAVKP